MIVKYSGDTKEDFRNHRTYLSGVIKTDGSEFNSDDINRFSRNLKKDITAGLENTKEHKDSIYPKEFDYDSENYKMYIDKIHHYVVFYKIN